ncbi:MAG TPA: hypothetical protein VGI58_12590 [Streptosporangiaceae bacterium]|jgi:hypothetical protein
MSGGEVGVNPELVSTAASALENLRNVLSTNVPIIVNTMNGYWNSGAGSPVSLAALNQALGRSADDAASMRSRASLAADWERQHVSLSGGIVTIPWNPSDALTAQADAQNLAAAEAEADSNPKAARTAIQAVQADIQDHADSGDKQWLADFYNDGAPSVANLAQTLHNIDGANAKLDYQDRFTVLTKADQQILATFGQGLAATDKAGLLSPPAAHAIADAPDIWSATMLVKFGPPGSDWAVSEPKSPLNKQGVSLLALMTQSVYTDEQNGTLTVPVGYGASYDQQDRDQLQQTLANYDPLQVLLTADTQNKNATWQVMGGPDGAGLAKLLLGNDGSYDLGQLGLWAQGERNNEGLPSGTFTLVPPGKAVPEMTPMTVFDWPDPNAVGAFLNASTSVPRGHNPDAWLSAEAAKNIIDNTPPSGVFQEDPAVQQALLATAQRYLLDLSESTTYNGPSDVLTFGNNPDAPYILKITGAHVTGSSSDTPLSQFLNQILSNAHDAGVLNASIKTALGRYYTIGETTGFPPGGPASPDDDMASLLGRVTSESGNIKYVVGTQQDEQNAEVNSMIDFAKDAATWLPVVGDYADKAESVASLFGVPMDLPTDNAASAATANGYDFADAETQINVPMVQALINAHAIPASDLANQPWLVNGKIMLSDQSSPGQQPSAAAFSTWWDQYNKVHNLSAKEAEYQHQMELQNHQDAASGGGS